MVERFKRYWLLLSKTFTTFSTSSVEAVNKGTVGGAGKGRGDGLPSIWLKGGWPSIWLKGLSSPPSSAFWFESFWLLSGCPKAYL